MAPEPPVVLVTGATGPLGRVVAARFAADGARVALLGTDAGRLATLAAGLGPDGGRCLLVAADLRDPDDARRAAAAVEARYGRIDVLLHLVGGWVGGTAVLDIDPAEVRGMLDQHLWTTLHIVQAVVPGMVTRGFGRVLAVTSPLASTPEPRGASYALAKSAEEVLLRSLAREVSASGVTANLVVVRAIDAEHERETAPSPDNAATTTPEEIAATLAFLASPAAAAITGDLIPLHHRG